MNRHILVAYATRAGSTTGVAEAIGQTLREAGAQVDVLPVTEVRDLAGYDGLVLGSAVRVGKPLPELLHFADRYTWALNDLPVAYFVVCATMMENTPEHREVVLGYLTPLRRIREPVSIGLFAGAYDPKSVNLLLRWLARAMHAPEGDWRSWAEIRDWARALVPLLIQPAADPPSAHREDPVLAT
jgi:menaquinone-dependent protoporphyrinogen oxidase